MIPESAPLFIISPLIVLLAVGPVIIPVTPRVPATVVSPELSVTVNLLVLMAKVVPSSVSRELPIAVAAVNLGTVLAVPEPVISPPVEQAPQLGVVPPRRHWVAVPAASLVNVVVEFEYKSSPAPTGAMAAPSPPRVTGTISRARVTVEVEPPPVKPVPAVILVIPLVELEPAELEMVIVEPEVETVVLLPALMLIAPLTLLSEVTSSVLLRETTGF